MTPPLLVPTPQRVTDFGGHSPWPSDNVFLPLEAALQPLGPALIRFLDQAKSLTSVEWRILPSNEKKTYPGSPHVFIAEDRSLPTEGYRLSLGANGISLFCRDWRGGFYALQTLRQLLIQFPDAYPHLEIEDAPALPHRGYMLDISRTRVPKTETLHALIDRLAGLKFNQLQLYIEHTFAFSGHGIVWGQASPLNADEIRALDTYAAERGIELVANFNSFGHFERWLRHPPYFRYAECPYGWRRPDGHGMAWGSTLAPTAESQAFLAELFQEYFPLFRSRLCNIGGDEPWELGTGKSRDRCEKEGKHAVYLDFLHGIVEKAAAHKERVQFWADIVLERPECVPDLDPRLIALVWGYEADHPLDEQAAHFAASGLPFYICPGTSSWNSFGTRLTNARANISAAGAAAKKHGAEGLLLTDWGDYGHHQPPIVSLAPILFAAQAAWAPEKPIEQPEAALGLLGLPEGASELAPFLFRLGAISEIFSFRPHNRMPLATLLNARHDQIPELSEHLATEELEAAERILSDLAADLDAITLTGAENEALREDLLVAIGLLGIAARRALLHRQPSRAPANRLREDYSVLIGRYECCWVRGHRIGGLRESASWLQNALDSVPSTPARRLAWPATAWRDV